MANNLNYAELYQAGLQTRYPGRLYFEKLWNTPSNSLVKFSDAKTIKLPRLTVTSGRKDYGRDTVTTPGRNFENDWETKTLTNDRYWDTLIDPMDIDETNMVASIANITRVYNDNEKIPEKDKYMISRLFSEKKSKDNGAGNKEIAITPENALTVFDEIMENMDEKEVPQEGRLLYVLPTVKTALKQAKEIARYMGVQNNNGQINRVVNRLDEVEIIGVPSSRMKTLYNFTNGAKPDPTAQQVQMMLIHTSCMVAPEKYEFVSVDAPSAKTAGKYFYFERSYDGVFMFDTKTDGIAFVTAPKA
ncbi:TPA: capsid protein [Bacillus cereus]|uniref:capsid protein n=2 Tax=Bacilli TaxID=91061 RepID=UPI001C3060D2|nr:MULTISPECIES: capsid protein [Bacillales]MCP1181270.1 capsid protein [Bacillus sp. 1663tsa1]MCU5751620.1 capsid protein [Bacillus cereus]HDX9631452.1 capsid protein [Bacillus cereus]